MCIHRCGIITLRGQRWLLFRGLWAIFLRESCSQTMPSWNVVEWTACHYLRRKLYFVISPSCKNSVSAGQKHMSTLLRKIVADCLALSCKIQQLVLQQLLGDFIRQAHKAHSAAIIFSCHIHKQHLEVPEAINIQGSCCSQHLQGEDYRVVRWANPDHTHRCFKSRFRPYSSLFQEMSGQEDVLQANSALLRGLQLCWGFAAMEITAQILKSFWIVTSRRWLSSRGIIGAPTIGSKKRWTSWRPWAHFLLACEQSKRMLRQG